MSQPSETAAVLIRRLVNKAALSDMSLRDLRLLSSKLERGELTHQLIRVFNTELNIQLQKKGGGPNERPTYITIPDWRPKKRK